MPVAASALRLTRGLRFRITVSYAIFFILIAAGAGAVSRQSLQALLEARSREALSQEWGAIKGYLHIEEGRPVWFYDRDDPDESFIVGRLQRIYLLAAASGQVLERSDLYRSIGIDSPEEIRDAIESNRPVWRIRRDPEGMPYLIRSGVFLDERSKTRYYVAIGRSLVDSRRVVEQFTWLYFFLTPVVILGGCLIGWFLAGRALMPVHDVASAAQRISGSNLSLRIAIRGAGDELDYLIATFNRMIERLESSFEQVRRFSTDVSHELRTPITAIRGQLEVALYTAKSTEQYRDAVANALEDIERLSQIVRALLLLSQAESGQVVLQKVRLDLSVLAAEVLEQFQILAEEGKHPADCGTAGRLRGHRRPDPDRTADLESAFQRDEVHSRRRGGPRDARAAGRPGAPGDSGYRVRDPAGAPAAHFRPLLPYPGSSPPSAERPRPGVEFRLLDRQGPFRQDRRSLRTGQGLLLLGRAAGGSGEHARVRPGGERNQASPGPRRARWESRFCPQRMNQL